VVLPEELIEKLQEENSRAETILYLGFQLPIGWEVSDSICFVGDMDGIFTYSEKRTTEMEKIDPAKHDHYWWVGETTPPLSITCGSLYCYPEIKTDNQGGDFSIDYMLGYNGTLNTRRWNNQFINIGTEDTVYVTTPNEFGPGSINDAIKVVKHDGVIIFDFQNPETILITEEIRIYKDVTIRGNENAIPVLACENPCRTIKIEDDLKVDISNLQIHNGYAGSGGGLYCGEKSLVTLNNITFQKNRADNDGGAIFCGEESRLNIKNTIILSNSAQDGGGVYCDMKSKVMLENVKFTDNIASGLGGGLYANNMDIILTDIDLKMNSANKGGAIYTEGGSPLLEKVSISKNNAGQGGGIFFENATTPILKNVFITENSATNGGGGLYINNSFPLFDSEERCNIYLNVSMNGGDFLTNNSIEVVVDTFSVLSPNKFHATPFSLYNFDILNGKMQQFDGDLYVSPAGDNLASGLNENEPMRNIWAAFSKILADSLHNNTIYLSEGTYSPSSNDELFPINVPDYISIQGASESTTIIDAEGKANIFNIHEVNNTMISNLTITGGSSEFGGGICCEYSDPLLQNLIIESNIALKGGGMYCNYSNPLINEVSFINNMAEDTNYSEGEGGGILLRNSNPELSNIEFSENRAKRGGAIKCRFSNPYMNNINIFNNSANLGGGIYLDFSDPLIMNMNLLQNNADSRGGALYAYQSNSVFINVKVCENSAPDNGGGFFFNVSTPLLYNMIFNGNTSTKRGGGIYCTTTELFLSNGTFANNVAGIEGGGIYSFRNSSLLITNSILWDNVPEEVCLSQGYSTNTLSLSYSDVKGDTAGVVANENILNWMNGNIAADPLFCGSGSDPCDLVDMSPCIDAGNPDTTGLNLPLRDLLGDIRILDGNGDGLAIVDMGAYEYIGTHVGEGSLQVASSRLQVFPNPTRGISDIRYHLPAGQAGISDTRYVSLGIFDLNGNELTMLEEINQSPGDYKIKFNASTLPAGIYLVRLQAGEVVVTEKLVVMR